MKRKLLFLMAICICGCMSMLGRQTKPTEPKLESATKENSIGKDLLPTPQWEEGYATVTGATINYDPAKDDNPNAKVYPRSSFGSYIDQKHGTAPVDSAGNYKVYVKLYQTHQPCFIDIPGYYGLMYLSPGENVNITVDYAGRWANGHQGNDGTVLFAGGADSDINNMLATNTGHDVIWNSFGKNGAYYKTYADNAEFVDAVMAHRASQYAHVDTLPFTDRMKQLLRLDIDCNAANAQLMAPYYQLVKPDSAYYSFIPALGLDSHKLRWAANYDTAVSYCSRLYLSDDSGPQTAQIDASILEDLLATDKLDADETKLVEGILEYNIDRLPADVLEDGRKRLSGRVDFLCDSLQLQGADSKKAERLQTMLADDNIRDARKIYNAYLKFISELENNHGILSSYHKEMTDDDFSSRQSAFYEANSDALDALQKKYNNDLQMIFNRHDMAKNIQRFIDITGIDDEDIRQNMIISTYAAMVLRGELLPDEVLNDEIKDFSPVAVAFLTEQNNVQKQILGKAVSNVSQMSPDDDADKIILNLVEKHKGKMIFIDIWNTWCGSCLQAMTEHEQVKGDYTDKVAFVYLADETSPEELWNKRIKNFTGDHYRLPLDQHQSLMQRFNFHSYPSYIIIGSNGDILCTTNHFHSLTDELDKWLK